MACTEDSETVALTITAGVLEADVKISSTAGNRATANADGIYVAGDFIETGDYVWSGRATKTGFLLCDGTAVSRSTYATLFAQIGTQYGSGDGSTTFNLPDGRDRTLVGAAGNTALAANDGVLAANRHGTRHRHTPHQHTIPRQTGLGGAQIYWTGNNDAVTIVNDRFTGLTDGGSGVAADPLDGPAFLGANLFVKT